MGRKKEDYLQLKKDAAEALRSVEEDFKIAVERNSHSKDAVVARKKMVELKKYLRAIAALAVLLGLIFMSTSANAQIHVDKAWKLEMVNSWGIDPVGDTVDIQVGREISSIRSIYFNGFIDTNDPFTANFGGEHVEGMIKDIMSTTALIKFDYYEFLRKGVEGHVRTKAYIKDGSTTSATILAFDKNGKLMRVILIVYPEIGVSRFFFDFKVKGKRGPSRL